MRICPKCGHQDEPYWKQCAFRQHISYCKIGDLELFEPNLALELKKELYIGKEFYAYHLTKGGRVERVAISDNPTWQKRWYIGTYERSKANKLPNQYHVPSLLANKHIRDAKFQTKLFEVKNNE